MLNLYCNLESFLVLTIENVSLAFVLTTLNNDSIIKMFAFYHNYLYHKYSLIANNFEFINEKIFIFIKAEKLKT